jgi:hypothetical protein
VLSLLLNTSGQAARRPGGQAAINGYLSFDGQVSPIASAKASADLDDNMVHRAARGRIVDKLDRETAFESQYSAGWSMPIQHLLLNVELGWPADYVRNLTPLNC